MAQCSSDNFKKRKLPIAQSVVPAKVSHTDFDGPGKDQESESFIPEEVAPTGKVLKEGVVSDDDLEELSNSISKLWMKLGRRLHVRQEDLDCIDVRWPDLFDKAYRMLLLWKQKNASDATYCFLCQGLCHKFVDRKDLAQEFCFH